MTDNLNDRLEQAAFGPKDLNIDEKRQFLGNLRERIFLLVTVPELHDAQMMAVFFKHFADYQDYHIILNGSLINEPAISKVEMMSNQHNIPFSIVNSKDAKLKAKNIAILVVAKTAINQETIDLKEKYPTVTTTPEKPAKTGFFSHLFGKK